MTLKRFIPKIIFIAAMSASMLSCSENEEQKLAKEKAKQDSIRTTESNRQEEKSFEDSMVNVAKSPKKEKEDSTAAQVDGAADPGVK